MAERLIPANDAIIGEDLTWYELPLDFQHETWYKKNKFERLLTKTMFPKVWENVLEGCT